MLLPYVKVTFLRKFSTTDNVLCRACADNMVKDMYSLSSVSRKVVKCFFLFSFHAFTLYVCDRCGEVQLKIIHPKIRQHLIFQKSPGLQCNLKITAIFMLRHNSRSRTKQFQIVLISSVVFALFVAAKIETGAEHQFWGHPKVITFFQYQGETLPHNHDNQFKAFLEILYPFYTRYNRLSNRLYTSG